MVDFSGKVRVSVSRRLSLRPCGFDHCTITREEDQYPDTHQFQFHHLLPIAFHKRRTPFCDLGNLTNVILSYVHWRIGFGMQVSCQYAFGVVFLLPGEPQFLSRV